MAVDFNKYLNKENLVVSVVSVSVVVLEDGDLDGDLDLLDDLNGDLLDDGDWYLDFPEDGDVVGYDEGLGHLEGDWDVVGNWGGDDDGYVGSYVATDSSDETATDSTTESTTESGSSETATEAGSSKSTSKSTSETDTSESTVSVADTLEVSGSQGDEPGEEDSCDLFEFGINLN